MKKNEIALLIVIVGLSGLSSYFILNSLIKNNTPQTVTVKTANQIESTIKQPNELIFRDDAYNPTIKVKIGDQAGQQPFNATQQ